jgi:hypothetical protein
MLWTRFSIKRRGPMKIRTFLGVAVALAAFGAAGCKPTSPQDAVNPAPQLNVVASVKQIMQGIVIPASDAVWAVPGAVPKDDMGWLKVESNALMLSESANLLLVPGRAIDQDEWAKQSIALRNAASSAAAAIRDRDVDKISAAGDALYEVCEGCHRKYLKDTTGG